MPFRVFAAGEVLTAANVNDYLAEQAISTFAGTAARASAITAPTEGQFAYLSDSDSLTFYNGSAWVNAGSAIAGTALSSGTATSGQVLTANGSGAVTFSTPTQGLTLLNTTSFTSVSSQSFTNVFSDTYNVYRIIMRVASSSGGQVLSMRLRENTTDKTTGYYGAGYKTNYAGTVGSYGAKNNGNESVLGGFNASDPSGFVSLDLMRKTGGASVYWTGLSFNTNDAEALFFGYQNNTVTNATGFTIYNPVNNILGTVSIYGYNQ